MERVTITVSQRDTRGKGPARRLRRDGSVPAVVYSHDFNQVISVPLESIKVLRSLHFSESSILDMKISGEEKPRTIPVLIKSIQFNPVSDKLEHIDFLQVSLKDKIKVHIPIVLKGAAKGVKEGEGVLNQVLRDIEVEGLPLDIPEHIELDVSELEIGDSLHVEHVQLAGDVRITADPEATVVSVVAKVEEVEPEAEEVAAEGAEPEVIKEKKEGEAPEAQEKKDSE